LLSSVNVSKAALQATKENVKHTKALWQSRVKTGHNAFSTEAIKSALFAYDTAASEQEKASYNLQMVEQQLGAVGAQYPAIIAAKAAVYKAQYDLAQTTVLAPISGVITNLYLVPGEVLAAGRQQFSLVADTGFWVQANYKEKYLKYIKVGDQATVYLKMYSGEPLKARVSSIGYGVNRRQASNTVITSALPYIEQSEDWIQLAQRFPVYIALTKPPPGVIYRIGASARVFIHRG